MNHNPLRSAVLDEIAADQSSLEEIRAHMTKIVQQRRDARRRRLAVVGTVGTVAAVVGAAFVMGGGVAAPNRVVTPQAPSSSAALSTTTPSDAIVVSPDPTGASDPEVSSRMSAAEESARIEAERDAQQRLADAEAARAATQAAAQSCSDFGRLHPAAVDGVVNDAAVVALATECARGFRSTGKPTIEWVETDARGVQTFLDSAPSSNNDPFLLVTVRVALAPPFGDGKTAELGTLTIPLKDSTVFGMGFPATVAPNASLDQLGTVHRN